MRYASLRQGLVGAWCPSVSGPFGYRLPDMSGYGNHGTLNNMDPSSDWVTSGGKGALDFDGSNDSVTTTSVGANTSSRAISAWFKTVRNISTYNNYMCITGWGTADFGKMIYLYIGTDIAAGVNALGVTQYGTSLGTGTLAVNTGNWTHGCAVNIGNNYAIYVNGNLINTKSMTTSPLEGAKVSIGAFPFSTPIGSNGNFDGQLDDIRIYNRALTEQEIRLLASERGIGLKPERQRNRYMIPRNRSSRFIGFPS